MEVRHYATEKADPRGPGRHLSVQGWCNACWPNGTDTIKNLDTAEAKYSVIGNNEALTNSSATPKPQERIPAQQSSTFTVKGPLSPDITTATVRYSIAGKTCVFRTTFVNTIVPGGLGSGTLNKVPKWTKDAEASGGARCTATIT